MTYRHFRDEQAALAFVATEKAQGRQAYMLRQRAGSFEVRTWS